MYHHLTIISLKFPSCSCSYYCCITFLVTPWYQHILVVLLSWYYHGTFTFIFLFNMLSNFLTHSCSLSISFYCEIIVIFTFVKLPPYYLCVFTFSLYYRTVLLPSCYHQVISYNLLTSIILLWYFCYVTVTVFLTFLLLSSLRVKER